MPIYADISEAFAKMGYSNYFVPKPNKISGSAIFYKKDLFNLIEQSHFSFNESSSQFLMFCKLQSLSSPTFEFIFAETHLKAKPEFMNDRIRQTLKIIQFFNENYQDLPVILSGDFNEEPQNKPISDIMESNFIDFYTMVRIQ